MRYFSHVAVTAGLVCCLAASPACADVAAPEAGASEASSGEVLTAMQALQVMIDAASTVPGSSAYASETKSIGPAGAPLTSEGVDSSNGTPNTEMISTAGFGNTESPAGSATGAVFQAAPPAGLGQVLGGHLVGSNASVASLDLSSLATSASNPQIVAETSTDSEEPPPAVPVPPTILLMGAGLLGILPWRRSSRISSGT